jgi:uncharacterized membrane protein YhhN
MRKFALAVFAIASLAVLTQDFLHHQWLAWFSKPLLVPSLLTFYYFSVSRENRSPAFIVALIFCFAGDVLLMNAENFVFGLAAFLFGHVLFIFAYRQHQNEDNTDALQGLQRVRLAFPVILAGTGLVVVLLPKLDDLLVPVVIYAAVITFMVLSALFRYGRTVNSSFWRVFIGAALFMTSDSILAINKFLVHLNYPNLYIMATYCLAQYLIVSGIIKHADSEPVLR